MGDKSKVWYLQHINLFGSLAEHEIEEIARMLGDRRVPAGSELLAEQEDRQLCIIKEGVVRIHLDHAEHQRTVALLGSGRVFGPSSRFGDSSPHPRATTLTPSYVCFASWPMMMEVAYRYPRMMVAMVRGLADVATRAELWRSRLGLASPADRLEDLLMELSSEFGEPTDEGRRIPFRLTQEDLGHMVGLSRETVSRLMAEFAREGWVARENGTLVVRNRAGPRRPDDAAL